MKETTDKAPNEFTEWWNDLEPGAKFSFSWLALLALALITVGIIFPYVGLGLLALVVIFTTIGVVTYLLENY